MTIRTAALALCAIAALALAACGPSDSDKRTAFIGFLQSNVLSQKGARIPKLTDKDREQFGEYAAQYDIITRFHEKMNTTVTEPMKKIVANGSPQTIQQVLDRRQELAELRNGIGKVRDALQQNFADAEKEKAALKQPPDLEPVYAAAYDKLVAGFVKTFNEVFPTIDAAFEAVQSFGNLIEQNRTKVKVNGSMLETSDEKLRQKLNDAMSAMNEKRTAVNAATQKLRAQIYGN